MIINQFRIKGFRSIKEELTFDVHEGLILVGPNNSGKTNIMKSLRYFFTGYDNKYSYRKEFDLSFGEEKSFTNISCTFSFSDNGIDEEIYELFQLAKNQLSIISDEERQHKNITIYLTFSANSKPTYRIYPNHKRPAGNNEKSQYSRTERKLIEKILNRFSIHYIPSDKNTQQLYDELVLPFLWKKSYSAISQHIALISSTMEQTASSLNEYLKRSGMEHIECLFTFPDTPERIFKDIEFQILDPHKTTIFSKGMGIQSAALLAAFNWITEQEISEGKNVLWLLEEPESYLHPELSHLCSKLINALKEKSQVFITTHSMSFVPSDPSIIAGIYLEDNWTKVRKFKNYLEATDKIRKSLGVKVSDFFNMNTYNVIVEGETDRDYMKIIINFLNSNNILKNKYQILTSERVSFLDFGGVSGVEGFIKALFEYIRNEKPTVIMLDGDDAGIKCSRAIKNYLGNKGIHLENNKDIIIGRDRFPIEGLFPDEWIKNIHDNYAPWFEDFSMDAQGQILPFKIRDQSKTPFFNKIREFIHNSKDNEWLLRWTPLLNIIESSLENQGKRIYGTSQHHLIGGADTSQETIPESNQSHKIDDDFDDFEMEYQP